MTSLVAALLSVSLIGALPESAANEGELADLCARFSGHDQDGDGTPELGRLRLLGPTLGEGARVLILVEPRLVADDASLASIAPEIERLAADIAGEGWSAAIVEVELARRADRPHRDGLTLLALRSFLRGVHSEQGLAGVVLVGRFPDAFLVRTCNWRKHQALTLHKKTEAERSWDKVEFVRRVPEAVARRCDLVLADLDGHWEDLYVEPRVELRMVQAAFEGGVPKNGGLCTEIEIGRVAHEDFFHVNDGRLEVADAVVDGEARHWVILHDHDADLECSTEDRAFPNALSRPEIFVSRINAYGVALSPKESVVDKNGTRLLDDSGHPQTLEFAEGAEVPSWSNGIWEQDAALERDLLRSYFDRNHAFRTQSATDAFRPSSIACDLGSGYKLLCAASPDWAELDEPQFDIKGRPSLIDFMAWLQRPAVLRAIQAHSDPWGSVFAASTSEELNALFDDTPRGAPLSWTRKGSRLVPSLERACRGGKLDFFFLRGLHGTDIVPVQGSIILNTGCQGIAPPSAATLPYDAPNYGRRSGGNSLLFFAGGVAMMGRAKVFYDSPRGFGAALAEGGTVGHAWARYFNEETRSTWARAGGDIGRKRSYFWSVLGDWTLRLPVSDQ